MNKYTITVEETIHNERNRSNWNGAGRAQTDRESASTIDPTRNLAIFRWFWAYFQRKPGRKHWYNSLYESRTPSVRNRHGLVIALIVAGSVTERLIVSPQAIQPRIVQCCDGAYGSVHVFNDLEDKKAVKPPKVSQRLVAESVRYPDDSAPVSSDN